MSTVDHRARPTPSSARFSINVVRAACRVHIRVVPRDGVQGAEWGKPIMDAAHLAIIRFNDANPSCRLNVATFDTRSNDIDTLAAARALVGDSSVIATIGPMFSREMDLVGGQLDAAGFVVASPSATRSDLTGRGFVNFVRGVADDDQYAVAGATI